MYRKPGFVTLFLILLFAAVSCSEPDSDSNGESRPQSASTGVSDSDLKDGVSRGIKFIRKHQDVKSGGVRLSADFPPHPGVTAMALLSYMRSYKKYTAEDGPFVRNGLEWLVSLQKEDGSIYQHDSANYCTSLAIAALVEGDKEKYRPQIEKARDFLVRLQASEETGYRTGDRFYGGVGYGGDERPDLSNTQFGVAAVHAAGLPKDHPFYRRATRFLERNQNWGETNDQVWKDSDGNEVRPGNDGGAIYMPGESKAGVELLPDGRRVFRSYGSMSYALLKSYVFCGLDRRDPRVRSVVRWCEENFQVEWHPGFEKMPDEDDRFQGLFYYYFSMAQSLGVFGKNELTDAKGQKHDWRRELAAQILSLQQPDGSFLNSRNPRWQENFPVLCTLYAVLALEECHRSIKAQ